MARSRTSSGFEIVGIDEFQEVLEALGPAVVSRVRRNALRKAATKVAREVRKSAPKQTGALKKSIGVKNGKFSSFVGLNKKLGADGKAAKKDDGNSRIRFYYKVLDLESVRGEPLAPWFDDAIENELPKVGEILTDEMKKALSREAGKAFTKSAQKNGYKGRRGG